MALKVCAAECEARSQQTLRSSKDSNVCAAKPANAKDFLSYVCGAPISTQGRRFKMFLLYLIFHCFSNENEKVCLFFSLIFERKKECVPGNRHVHRLPEKPVSARTPSAGWTGGNRAVRIPGFRGGAAACIFSSSEVYWR